MKFVIISRSIWLILLLSLSSYADRVEVQADRLLNQAEFTGGLIVQLDGADPELTKALGRGPRTRVHALHSDLASIQTIRQAVFTAGSYGKISAEHYDGIHLPYVDNLINFIYVPKKTSVKEKEILRVLRPLGVALIGGKKIIKPWPDSIDEWTHYLHGPDNNAVARDQSVDMPRALQWVAKPKWGRSHEQMASMSVAVSAKGRLFSIMDDAPLASVRYPPDWNLVARDAFNGVLLWKRDLTQWIDHLRHFRSGPVHLPRRLVAEGDRVYVTLGLSGSVEALDAASGETLHTYKGTEYTEEIIFSGGILYLVIGTSEVKREGGGLFKRNEPAATDFRYITAIKADTGKSIWKKEFGGGDFLLPSTLAINNGKVGYQSTYGVACLNAKNGKQLWSTPRVTPNKRMGYSAPTLVLTDEVLLCADRDVTTSKNGSVVAASGPPVWGIHGWNASGFPRKGKTTLKAYAVADGKELWSAPCAEGYNSPVDLFVVGDLVWVGTAFKGHDLKTGVVKKEFKTRGNQVSMPHHRCYRNKASERFIFTGWSGIEVVSLDKGWLGNNSWVRGTCQYGIMPGNGFLYAPPDACACNPGVKMPGVVALAPQRGKDGHISFPSQPVLVKGPAYGQAIRGQTQDEEWPMYRRDASRSGFGHTRIPDKIQQEWSAEIGGQLTQPIGIDGRIYVASINAHTVFCLDAENGHERWKYTTGGRIDSAPTYHDGQLFFGSADGWITSLRADNGALVWRFRAAPEDRRISVYGQLESVWPVHGSILIQNNTLYAAAGRSSYLDGGIIMYRLDPKTGKQNSRNVVYHLDPDTGEQLGFEKKGTFNMEGTMTDILSGDGDAIFMKEMSFDATGRPMAELRPHLYSITGFLGEEWFVRSYWMLGSAAGSGWGRWAKGANNVPAGRILCFNDDMVFGYGRKTVAGGAVGHAADEYHLFGQSRKVQAPPPPKPQVKTKGKRKKKPIPKKDYAWTLPGDLHVRAMVMTHNQIAVAGPMNVGQKSKGELSFQNQEKALESFLGSGKSRLSLHVATTGESTTSIELKSPPVFDGLSASKGKLLISLKDGRVVCFGNPSGVKSE